MPFAEAKKRLASTDVHQRGLLGMIINEHTGIYTYVFDDIDYSNLRKSLIESLQKGNYFRAVNDIANVSESGKGTRLYIDFSESGIIHSESGFMNLNKKAHCILNAYAWTEYPNGNLRTKKEITIEESSGISVADAKNKAILKFIEEISTIL